MSYRPRIKTSSGKIDFPLDAETVKGKTILEQTYPVGSIYLSVESTSPASLFGGTWELLKDRFLLGSGDIYGNGNTGGEATHQLTVNEMPSHSGHLYTNDWVDSGNSVGKYLGDGNMSTYGDIPRGWNTNGSGEYYPNGQNLGGSQAHNNMPPYLVVNMWKRTA